MQNIELKARLVDLEAARRVAREVATEHLGVQHQVDTYFRCHHGRLKLRQIDGVLAQLVSYARPDDPGPKQSDYTLVPVSEPERLKGALSAALGVRCVVEKRREIFLHHNVRIHLDEVVHLGSFLEFEAVLGPTVDAQTGRRQVDSLAERFALARNDWLTGSYAEMLSQ
ncbi:MAG: class IV adenylate cyclase [Planctomycetota bacterium]